MQIPLVAGVGYGSTLPSAFDDALRACGVLNYNLIPLSSVIPPATTIVPKERYTPSRDEHGHRLYVVKADMRSDHAGWHVGAGIGWYQWGDGRGVFVEHEAIGPTRAAVATEMDYRICQSLFDLCVSRSVPFEMERLRSKRVYAEVGNQPTCGLVLAVFQSEAWPSASLSEG
jgi:arginine decarboxylase